MHLPAGTILRERYQVTEAIGQGGMGSIFQAEDLRLSGRLCAIKAVPSDLNLSSEARDQANEQFYREASVLARLDHPGLPKVSDYFSERAFDYLVMDYVPGDDLRTILATTRATGNFLPEEQVLDWAKQILDTLAYLHNQPSPVVHRDIKPGNIKLTPDGRIKIVDFGLVKLMAPDERTITVVQGRGTAHYTPLEQYGGDTGHTEPRTDIYAFGATLYTLLTNEPPVEAKQRFLSPNTLIHPREINPAISLRTERAILWALGLHPDERPPTVEHLRKALFEGIFPDETGTFVYVPQSRREWLMHALSDPTQRVMAVTAGFLLLVALITTLLSR